MNVTMHASEGQPATGSPYANARTAMKQVAANATTHNNKPTHEAIDSGTVEQEVIPSTAYMANRQKFQFVRPAARDTLG